MKQLTLTIGKKSKKSLLTTLRHTEWSQKQLMGMKIATEAEELNLEIYTGQELGFVGIGTRKQIYDRGKALGLALCPAEIAFHLRETEGALLAMEPIMDEHGCPRIFQTASDKENDDFRWVYAPSGYPELVWGDFYRWVFVRPKAVA